MSEEENKGLRRRFVEELNKGRVIDELFATDFVLHSINGVDIRGIKDLKQMFSSFFSMFPDFHFTIDDMIAEGDKVVERFTMTGTHKDTNKKVKSWAICIVRVAGGKFVEEWERTDTLGLMQQLGVIPTPEKEK